MEILTVHICHLSYDKKFHVCVCVCQLHTFPQCRSRRTQNRSFIKALNPEPLFDHTPEREERERGPRRCRTKPVQTNLPYLFFHHLRAAFAFGIHEISQYLACFAISVSALISRPTGHALCKYAAYNNTRGAARTH
jgi:hypothetical protein